MTVSLDKPATVRATGASIDVRVADRPVLQWWLLSRVATFWTVWVAGFLFFDDKHKLTPYLERWRRWDVEHYEYIARHGYAIGTDPPREAFFPGYPLMLRAVHTLGVPYTLAGLLISFVAGTAAVISLGRMAEERGPAGTGERAVALLLLSPVAVFLAAGYTEALFLAFALPAWRAARRGDWWMAGLLAAGASSIRITGVFLFAALVVEFAVGHHQRGRWRLDDLPALALPLLPPAAYAFYLHQTEGDWLAWLHAQKEGWDRSFTTPVKAFRLTWDAAFGSGQELQWQWSFRLELVAVLIGVLLTAYLLWARQWSEATYVGLTVVALATSTWYFSVPRAMVLWWPLWIVLGQATMRRAWLMKAYLVVVAPLSVVYVLLFVTYHWAG